MTSEMNASKGDFGFILTAGDNNEATNNSSTGEFVRDVSSVVHDFVETPYQPGYFPESGNNNQKPIYSRDRKDDFILHKYTDTPKTTATVKLEPGVHIKKMKPSNVQERSTSQNTPNCSYSPGAAYGPRADNSDALLNNKNQHSSFTENNLPNKSGPQIDIISKNIAKGNNVISARDDSNSQITDIKKNHNNSRSMGSDLPELPRVQNSENHRVLYDLSGTQPQIKPYTDNSSRLLDDKRSLGFVKMPYSNKIKQYDSNNIYGTRWEIIQKALKCSSIDTAEDLQKAIATYNHPHGVEWKFDLLKSFFKETLTIDGEKKFFSYVLPKIIDLALRLPELVTQPIPLLKAKTEMSLSLSQSQIASLLANAFLCTFPYRNDITQNADNEFHRYPSINFDTMFNIVIEEKARKPIVEKLQCLLNYFNRVTQKVPTGVVTFTRRYIRDDFLDEKIRNCLGNTLSGVDIIKDGVIEDSTDALQVDFANKVIGGGVLGRGCVQEEIRFVACPELIVSRLFTEILEDNEAIVVAGMEQYNKYNGYSETFSWQGDNQDKTPYDDSGRRRSCLVAMDAKPFLQTQNQFNWFYVKRELHKAFVAFHNPEDRLKLLPVATGNWGCGVFGGDPILKFVIQVVAAALSKRDLKYYVLGDKKLKRDLENIYSHLSQKKVTAGQIIQVLKFYGEEPGKRQNKLKFMDYLINNVI